MRHPNAATRTSDAAIASAESSGAKKLDDDGQQPHHREHIGDATQIAMLGSWRRTGVPFRVRCPEAPSVGRRGMPEIGTHPAGGCQKVFARTHRSVGTGHPWGTLKSAGTPETRTLRTIAMLVRLA